MRDVALPNPLPIHCRNAADLPVRCRCDRFSWHGQPLIANDDLNEPFSTTVYMRREWNLAEAVEAEQAKRGVRRVDTALDDLGLLSAHPLAGQCSNKNPMVGDEGFEPPTSSV